MATLVELHRTTDSQRDELRPLVDQLRAALRGRPGPALAAERAAECLLAYTPGPQILSPEEQAGDADHYQQHALYVDPDLTFSIVALVWRAGQQTTIHDHRCWGAVAVLRGREQETLYSWRRPRLRPRLLATPSATYLPGEVSAFAPPGDIHQVRNPGPSTAISLHVYGADICAAGSSIRRSYSPDLVIAAKG